MSRTPKARGVRPALGHALLASILAVAAATAATSTPGCSSSSYLVDAGACEPYCLKWLGAKCKGAPTHDECLDECLFYQGQCPSAQNDFLRCATSEGTISCDGDTGLPHSVGCNKWLEARKGACTQTFTPDGGFGEPGGPPFSEDTGTGAFDTSTSSVDMGPPRL